MNLCILRPSVKTYCTFKKETVWKKQLRKKNNYMNIITVFYTIRYRVIHIKCIYCASPHTLGNSGKSIIIFFFFKIIHFAHWPLKSQVKHCIRKHDKYKSIKRPMEMMILQDFLQIFSCVYCNYWLNGNLRVQYKRWPSERKRNKRKKMYSLVKAMNDFGMRAVTGC